VLRKSNDPCTGEIWTINGLRFEDIAEYPATVDGLTFTEETSQYPGYRRFLITLQQPLDHDSPEGRQFGQRMVLHHADRGAPMILYTSGYMLFGDDYLSELGVMLAANQISTEQRFFDESAPSPLEPADWSLMTIAQAAHDHHRVVEALAPYYRAAWVSTGHSKGGMTSIYHRRFHPDDVDATVAYVAPISFATSISLRWVRICSRMVLNVAATSANESIAASNITPVLPTRSHASTRCTQPISDWTCVTLGKALSVSSIRAARSGSRLARATM